MKRRRIPLFFTVVILVATVYCAFTISTVISQSGEKKSEIMENEKEIAKLKSNIDSLEKEIKNSDSPKFVEKVAREDLGMVKPREIIYVDKDKDSKNK